MARVPLHSSVLAVCTLLFCLSVSLFNFPVGVVSSQVPLVYAAAEEADESELGDVATSSPALDVDIEDVGEEDVNIDGNIPSLEAPEDIASLLHMSAEQLKSRVGAMFDKMVPEGKTEITVADVELFYKAMITDSQRRSITAEFDTMDTNDDGKISFDELKVGTNEEEEEPSSAKVQDLKKRFDAVDEDKSGDLNLTELMTMMDPSKNRYLMDIEVKEILDTQDTDKDGKVSFQEFFESEEARAAEGSGERVDKTELSEEFKLYDLNVDGYIDVPEMEEVISNPSVGELRAYNRVLFAEKNSLNKEEWLKDYAKHALSVLTDNAELLRMPEDYPSVGLPFKNLPSGQYGRQGHDELR